MSHIVVGENSVRLLSNWKQVAPNKLQMKRTNNIYMFVYVGKMKWKFIYSTVGLATTHVPTNQGWNNNIEDDKTGLLDHILATNVTEPKNLLGYVQVQSNLVL